MIIKPGKKVDVHRTIFIKHLSNPLFGGKLKQKALITVQAERLKIHNVNETQNTTTTRSQTPMQKHTLTVHTAFQKSPFLHIKFSHFLQRSFQIALEFLKNIQLKVEVKLSWAEQIKIKIKQLVKTRISKSKSKSRYHTEKFSFQ